jgi:hypothetical protein
MKTYKVYCEEHVSRNDWRDGYGDYQNLELIDYGFSFGDNDKEALQWWKKTDGTKSNNWIFVEVEQCHNGSVYTWEVVAK